MAPRQTLGEAEVPEFLNTNESEDLRLAKRLININRENPNYRVKSEKSRYYGKKLEELEQLVDEIETRRRGRDTPPAPLSEQLPEGAKQLKKTPARVEKI